MANITIIGSGFAGLTAAKALRKQLPEAEISLVSPRAELMYAPSLIWIPTGLRKPADLIYPLERLFRKLNIRHIPASVTGLKNKGRTVITSQGEYDNDYLLIASGGRYIKKLPGIEHALTICEGVDPTVKMRDAIANMKTGTIAMGFGGNPKEPSAMRGGPMFELLFGVETMLQKQGRRDDIHLVFFSPAPQPGKRMGPKALDGIMKEMKKRGIETHLGHKMKEFTPEKVITEGGGFKADMICFMPGLTGPAWAADSRLPLSPGGLIQADEFCRVPDHPGVYVAGDSGSFPGPEWQPKQAHMADLQAEAAAKNIVAEICMSPPTATFKNELICIVDTLDHGILVYRTPERMMVWPSRFMHWAKRFFEWWYVRTLR
jgi:sulfide:quinone oxidoreductase